MGQSNLSHCLLIYIEKEMAKEFNVDSYYHGLKGRQCVFWLFIVIVILDMDLTFQFP